MLFTEYDEAKVMEGLKEVYREEGLEIGRAEGREKGREEGQDLLIRALEMRMSGTSYEEILEETGVTAERLEKIASMMKER